jgi:hypothetical protein
MCGGRRQNFASSNTNFTLRSPVLNPRLRGEKQVSNRLLCDSAVEPYCARPLLQCGNILRNVILCNQIAICMNLRNNKRFSMLKAVKCNCI